MNTQGEANVEEAPVVAEGAEEGAVDETDNKAVTEAAAAAVAAAAVEKKSAEKTSAEKKPAAETAAADADVAEAKEMQTKELKCSDVQRESNRIQESGVIALADSNRELAASNRELAASNRDLAAALNLSSRGDGGAREDDETPIKKFYPRPDKHDKVNQVCRVG